MAKENKVLSYFIWSCMKPKHIPPINFNLKPESSTFVIILTLKTLYNCWKKKGSTVLNMLLHLNNEMKTILQVILTWYLEAAVSSLWWSKDKTAQCLSSNLKCWQHLALRIRILSCFMSEWYLDSEEIYQKPVKPEGASIKHEDEHQENHLFIKHYQQDNIFKKSQTIWSDRLSHSS